MRQLALAMVLSGGLLAQQVSLDLPDARVPSDPQSASELYEHFDDDFRRLLAEAQQEMGKEILKYEAIAPGLLPKKITINGTHHDFGYLTGLVARKYGAEMYRRTASNEEMNRRIVEMYREVYPPYVEKAQGIAEAFGMTVDEIDFIYLEGYFDQLFWKALFRYYEFEATTGYAAPGTQCSLASYFFANDSRHIVGRNLDLLSDMPHFLVESNLDGAYRTIGHAQYSIHQLIPEGINEEGLFIGSAGVENPARYRTYVEDWRAKRYPDQPSVQYIHLHRLVLDTCATVDCALELIRKVSVWFPFEWSHVLIADAQGNSIVVEWDQHKNVAVFPRKTQFTALTNTALSEGTDYAYSTDWRYRTAVTSMSAEISDLGGLTQVMESIRPPSGAARTIYTLMADLSKREVTIYYRGEDFQVAHTFGFTSPDAVPEVYAGGIVSAANFRHRLAAGQIASVFGANLSRSTQTPDSLPLPRTLGAVTLTLNGQPAPLLYVSPSQINFQVPWELEGRSEVEVVVMVDGSSSEPQTISLDVYAPSVFPGAIVGQDGFPVARENPAEPGEILSIYCTGLGPVTNAPMSGHAVPVTQLVTTAADPEVWLAYSPAPVVFAGLAPGMVGVYQVNFIVPDLKNGLLPLVLSVAGVSSDAIELVVRYPS